MEVVGHNINMTVTKPSSKIFSKYTLKHMERVFASSTQGDSNWGMKYFIIDGGEGWWNAGKMLGSLVKHFDFLGQGAV